MEKIEEKPLNINIFRHGQANYEQQEVDIEEAEDLTDKGKLEVKQSTESLVELIQPKEEIEIWSSPKGRALETAKIVARVLKENGISIRNRGKGRPFGINVFEDLTEVKNFSWELFQPLVDGGEVEFAGQNFLIDKSQTNPNNLNYQQYFNTDVIKDIPQKYKNTLPKEYVEQIDGFEKFAEVTKRIMRPLTRLKKIYDKPYRVILTTHDALTGFIANIFSGGEKGGINPGEFINLERVDDKLVVTKIGELEEGDKKKDIVGEFKKMSL